jgi:hypothetical protein
MAVHELYSSNSNQYGHRTFIVPDTGVTIAMTLVGAGDPLAEYYNAVTGRHACISRRKQGMHELPASILAASMSLQYASTVDWS